MLHPVADQLALTGPWVGAFSPEACLPPVCLTKASLPPVCLAKASLPLVCLPMASRLRAGLPSAFLLESSGWDSGRRRLPGQAEGDLVSC